MMGVNGGVVPTAGGLLGRKSVPNAQGAKCQKCLQVGHWTYECKNKRKYVHRSSRTSMLNKRLNQAQNEAQGIPSANKTAAEGKKKKKKKLSDSGSSSSSSDSDSSDSSDDSSDSSDSSSSDSSSSSSSSSSSEDSDSSSSESSDSSSSSSSSTHKKAKKNSKEKLKVKKNDEEKMKKNLEEQRETDPRNELKDSNKSSRSFLKPVDSDEEYNRRKSIRDHGSNDTHKSRKQLEPESPERQHFSKKHGHESHRRERDNDSHSHLEECDRPPKSISIVNDTGERYERRKNSSVYWSKAGEEEEKKLLAKTNLAKQHDPEKKKKEHNDHKSYSKVSRRHIERGDSNEECLEKRRNNYDQWSNERQEECNLSGEENHTKRFYENIEHHGKKRQKEQDLYVSESMVSVDQSRSLPRMENVEEDLEEKNISSSYWSYEMERMRQQAEVEGDMERSPKHSRKSSHKKKRHNVDDYSNEINGSKKGKVSCKVVDVFDRTDKEKIKTDTGHEKSFERHKSKKDERKHHAKSKSHEEKKRKSEKHAGHAGSEEKHIDYDDFDLQGRNDFEPGTPTLNIRDSGDEYYAKGHSRKSKHKEKKSREFSIDSSDGPPPDLRGDRRPPPPKRIKKQESRSPERRKEDRKSKQKHR